MTQKELTVFDDFSVNVIVRRVGGGYGGKIFRSAQIATAAALVTHLLNKTCRLILPLPTFMQCIGKRIPTKCNMEVRFNRNFNWLVTGNIMLS